MAPKVPPVLDKFFKAYRAQDEAGVVACFAEDATVWGSATGLRSEGRASGRGVLRAALETFQIRDFSVQKVFGEGPEYGVILDTFMGDPEAKAQVETLWFLRLAEDGRIQHLSVLWDPRSALRKLS